MKQITLFICILIANVSVMAAGGANEKPTQHLQVADVTSMHEAKVVFLDKTAEIRDRLPLNLENAAHIHITTYNLEKSVAYFAENLAGEKQRLAKELAVVVEDIHLTSEGNRLEELQEHVDRYFALVDQFVFCF